MPGDRGMPERFYSSSGIPWATVRNLVEKKRLRPKRDLPLSVRPPLDSPLMIARRSNGVYKRKLAGGDSQIPCRSPICHRSIIARLPTSDRRGICRFPPWIPHSSIKAGLWWMSSQDEQTSRWILLLQFITLRFKFRNNGQGNQEEGQ